MKKHLFIFLMAFVASHGLKAQNAGELRYLNLVLPDNTVVSYEVTNGIDIHFQDSLMVVNGMGFHMEDFVKYYFSEGGEGNGQASLFSSGWNWWSSYVELDGTSSLQGLESSLGANGVMVKSQNDGYVSYLDGYGWYGSLTSINNESTYQVKANAACTVRLTGATAHPADHPITLGNGWSWIGYPVAASMGVEDALASIEPQDGDMLKSQNDGYASYLDGYGWSGSLNTLHPGMGLMYKSNAAAAMTLVYPESGTRAGLKANQTTAGNHWRPNLNAYPDNMTVTAVVELDDVELQGESYELAAFADGECRGSARLMYVEPIGRYVAFLTIAGDEAAELRFRLYDAVTGNVMETLHASSLPYETNATVGSLAAPYVVSFSSSTGIGEEPESHIAGGKLYVRSAGKDGSVVVSDVLGRVVYSQPIREEACVIDLDRLAPNTLYIIKVNNQTLKFIKQ